MLKRWKLAVAWSLASIGILLVSGFTYQWLRLRNLANELPAPGQRIQVGDSTLHYRLQGEGRPLVLLESGPGATSLEWTFLAPSLAQFTSVLTYDRGGLGWSDPATGPRIASRLARERHELLTSLGASDPVIMVGHSGGGLFARTHYFLYPEDFAALILIDSSHERQLEVMPHARESLSRQRRFYRGVYWASQFGVIELLRTWRGERMLPQGMNRLPQPARYALSRLYASPTHWSGVLKEFEALEESAHELVGLIRDRDLGSLPLVVLTGGERAAPDRDAWFQLQQDLAGQSSDSQQLVIAGAGHYVHEDRPEIVVNVIREMVQRVRTHGP